MFWHERRQPRMSWANAHAVIEQHNLELFSICAEAQAAFMRYSGRAELYWLSRDYMGVLNDNLF